MNTRSLLFGFLTIILAGLALAQTSTSNDFKPTDLIGEWEGYLVNDDGSKPSQRSGNVDLVITAETIKTTAQGNQGEGTYHVSAGDGKFHEIEATGTSGHYAGKTYTGIFTLEGNTLKWCSAEAGWARPKELKTKFSEGRYLMVLTRKRQ
jgi:uncharacterized protein (TIGR03067 family)